jgi:hypothetical protein
LKSTNNDLRFEEGRLRRDGSCYEYQKSEEHFLQTFIMHLLLTFPPTKKRLTSRNWSFNWKLKLKYMLILKSNPTEPVGH